MSAIRTVSTETNMHTARLEAFLTTLFLRRDEMRRRLGRRLTEDEAADLLDSTMRERLFSAGKAGN